MRVKTTSFGGADRQAAPSSSSTFCRRPTAVASPLLPPSRVDITKPATTSSVALASAIDRYSRLVFPLLFGVFSVIYWSVYLHMSVFANEHDFVFFD